MWPHNEFITCLCKALKVSSYLELGLEAGETFNIVSSFVPKCVGVDVNPLFIAKNGEIFKMTTDEYFANNNMQFDFIFIDADHHYEQVRQDFVNSVKVLNHGGTIVLHDTDPAEKYLLEQRYCGDAYKIIDFINCMPQFSCVTLPIDNPGLTVVRKKQDTRVKNMGLI